MSQSPFETNSQPSIYLKFALKYTISRKPSKDSLP